jgi:hypothetical protein
MAKKGNQIIAGRRPRLNIEIERLFLDKDNPRLPEEVQGKKESDLITALYRGFNLDELAESMSQNGYFDEEPLVVIPQKLPRELLKADPNSKEYAEFINRKDTNFVVVEGNRRLAAAKILLDPNLREKLRIKHWPDIVEGVVNSLKVLPTIVYSKRNEVVPYLGVRHIVGIQKWDSYAKARYIADLVKKGRRLQDIESEIGDKQGSARKNYISYLLVEQAKNEFDIDTRPVKDNFSLLILAIGQGKIKRFIGLPTRVADTNLEAPVPNDNIDNLKNLISWLFGDGRFDPVIKESRDITRYLTHVVDNKEALDHLVRTRELEEAYDLSDGEEQMVLRYLASANRKLVGVLGLVHRHKTVEVIKEVEKCAETADRLLKTVEEE